MNQESVRWRGPGRLVRHVLASLLLPAMLAGGPEAGAEEPKGGTPREPAALNTAADAAYLSENERQVILEINRLRSDPPGYAREYLEPLLTCYRGNQLHLPGEVPLVTKEGISALREAIRTLKTAPPAPLLYPDQRLAKAAADHRNDQSANGRTGHTGSDGSSARNRIERYGNWLRAMGENIFYGDPEARAVVLHLVIDDGIPGRGHRKNFLNPDFRLAGVAAGSHPTWRNLCVIDFAGGFHEETVQCPRP